MAEYRKFWLINALGDKYDLTDDTKNKTFLSSPSGLGFRSNHSTLKIGNSELLISEGLSMVDVTGDLIFYNSSPETIYRDYLQFIDFIKYKPIKLHYLTPNFVDDPRYGFYADVIISNLSKGEVSQNSTMSVNITFHRISQWMDASEKVYKFSNVIEVGGKYYDQEPSNPLDEPNRMLQRDYYYGGTTLSNSIISNTGTNETGFVLTIDGFVSNPMFTLYQDNVKYGIFSIMGDYDHVVLNTVEGSESLYLERNGVVISNPKQYQDFSKRDGVAYFTWCKLKVGDTMFNFTCNNDTSFSGTVELAFKNSYFSV